MGLCKIITWAILGPILLYAVLLGYVLSYHFLSAPPSLALDPLPKDLKEATLKLRKPLIAAHLDAFAGKNAASYLDKYVTEDATFEDPMQFWAGKSALSPAFAAFGPLILENRYDIRGEHHAPNQIVLDMTMNMKLDFFGLPVPVSLPMRQNLMLEPAAKPGGQEKVFAIWEDWGSNPLLTEKTATVKQVGAAHKAVRNGFGAMGLELFKLVLGKKD